MISVWWQPTRAPNAAIAAPARSSTSARSVAASALGTKKPVSRKGSAGGKRPVVARWLMRPWLTTLSTET